MKKKFYWRTNNQIQSQTLRVIDSDGKQIGLMEKGEALSLASQKGLDLVEIAPNAKPPVAKIIEFGKFLYQEGKKQKRTVKRTDLKEIRFSPFIAENDFQTRLVRVKEFLKEKNKVKLTVVFTKRQLGSKSFGYKIIERVLENLEGVHIDMEPKFFGKYLSTIISPKGQNAKNKDEKINNQEV